MMIYGKKSICAAVVLVMAVTTGARAGWNLEDTIKDIGEHAESSGLSGDYFICGGGDYEAPIYERTGNTWALHEVLRPWDTPGRILFGYSVAISGNVAVASGPWDMNYRGSAYTFRREGNTWLPMTKLTPFGLGYAEWFGECVAISDDTLVVGAPRGSDNGSAFVFQREGNAWVEVAVLTAPDQATAARFGHAVAIDGDRIVVGDRGASGLEGAAHIFDRNGETWTHRARLSSPTPMTRGFFGWSAGISGDTVVLGELASKSAYVFHEEGGIWVEQAQLHSATPGGNVHKTVAIEGDTIVLGHFSDNTFGSLSGVTNIFGRTGDTWTLYQQIFGDESNDRMGLSVAIDAGTIVTTAYGHDGVAYVYVPEPATLSVMTLCG